MKIHFLNYQSEISVLTKTVSIQPIKYQTNYSLNKVYVCNNLMTISFMITNLIVNAKIYVAIDILKINVDINVVHISIFFLIF